MLLYIEKKTRTETIMNMRKLIFCFLFLPTVMMAEDGSQLWLRYEKIDKTQVNLSEQSTTMNIAAGELRQYYRGGKVTLAIDKTLTANLGGDGYILRNDSIIATTDILEVTNLWSARYHQWHFDY